MYSLATDALASDFCMYLLIKLNLLDVLFIFKQKESSFLR